MQFFFNLSVWVCKFVCFKLNYYSFKMIHLWQKKGHNSYGALDQHAYVLKMENVNKMNNEIHFHLCGNETIKQTIIAEEKQENYSFYRHETEKKTNKRTERFNTGQVFIFT